VAYKNITSPLEIWFVYGLLCFRSVFFHLFKESHLMNTYYKYNIYLDIYLYTLYIIHTELWLFIFVFHSWQHYYLLFSFRLAGKIIKKTSSYSFE